MRSHYILLVIFSWFSITWMSCDESDCDRTGCQAMTSPALADGLAQGIAGVGASESDVVLNGCQTCSLSQGTLRIWSSADPVSTKEEGSAVIEATEVFATIQIDQNYQQALDVGHYLICTTSLLCTAVNVEDGEVTTIHVLFSFGGAKLLVFEPEAVRPRQGLLFQL